MIRERAYSSPMENFHKQPAINVCLNNLVESINCDKPCTEGYGVGNLMSKNFLEKNKGFLVERFIKPPIILTVEFSCEIDLRYISIVCNVGAQKSSGIEISIQPRSKGEQFESVSSGVLKGNEKGFVFHRYSEEVTAKFGGEFCFCCFRSARCLSNVKTLRIKIFKTQRSSVPALGKVDIWGVPHKILPQIKNSRPNDESKHLTPNDEQIGLINRERPDGKVTALKENRESSCALYTQAFKTVEFPEEFIDPITLNLMIQPVTLPSGNIVDISTLEKFEEAESYWGRGASDPFTGVPFTSTSKPISATDLKARIDKFLTDNCNHPLVKNIPRTVGHRSVMSFQNSAPKPTVSKLITEDIADCNEINHFKRRKIEGNENQCSLTQSCFYDRNEALESAQTSINIQNSRGNKTTISFEERMEKSLESLLKSTLSSLPRFSADDKKCDENVIECNICKVNENLFRIPCSHFICRKCLICLNEKGTLSCSRCDTSFKLHNVEKVHISN